MILSAMLMSGCASFPGQYENSPAAQETKSLDIDKEYKSYQSLHFAFQGRNYDELKSAADFSEDIYRKIMFDTNLLSFKPSENYKIIIYANQQEYRRATGYPEWSGGGTVTELLGKILPSERETKARTSIYTFEDIVSAPLFAHEISHLIFDEFMAFRYASDSDSVLWVNEGLATFEEFEARDASSRDEFVGVINYVLQNNAMPLEKFAGFVPLKETPYQLGTYIYRGRIYVYTNIDVWYWQARSITEFLIKKQGQYNFFVFLNSLKSGNNLLNAVQQAYPGKWRGLDDLEMEWKNSLKLAVIKY